ncbi:MAG TPA: two-component system response regulator BtsR [Geothrix sp.]|jgi:two-component system LytT family response regulator
MMRALIVDDEMHVREELGTLLAETGDYLVLGTCSNAIEALRAVKTMRPEVLFLDIHMPKVDGFQLLGMIDADRMPLVVFVTAYDEFALRAFEENALDYLLKPVQMDRLARTTEKLKRILRDGNRPAFESPSIERIPCVTCHGIKLIDTTDVEFVRSSESGVHVVTDKGEFLTELTLTVLEAKTSLFARCHKQILVNIRRIDEIIRQESSALIKTKSGKMVPVSRRFLTPLKERLLIH